MALRYSHTLIAVPKQFKPAPAQVRQFLQAMADAGVVPGDIVGRMLKPSGKTREMKNPFTKETRQVPILDRKEFADLHQFETELLNLPDYSAEISGFGSPRLAPLPLEWDGEYAVTIRCIVSSILRSTSDVHEDRQITPYRQPLEGRDRDGFFTDPTGMKEIVVPDAGCARFWIEFSLGNDLFPIIERSDLNILEPRIVSSARQHLGVDFVQGCNWG
jgi:hypothetical protein